MKRYAASILALLIALASPGAVGAQAPRRLAVTDAGKIRLVLSNAGTFGSSFVSRDFPCMEWPARSGIDHLVRGALWVGAISAATGDSLVTIGGRDAYYLDASFDNSEFTPLAAIQERSRIPTSPVFRSDAVSDQDLEAVYVDTIPVVKLPPEQRHRPMGIEILQTSYSWGCEPTDDVIVVQYDIVNVGRAALQDVYVGIYTELATNNRKAFATWPPGGAWFDFQKLEYWGDLHMLTNRNLDGARYGATSIAGVEVVGCGGRGRDGRGPDSLATKRISLEAWTWSPSRFYTWTDDSLYTFISSGKIEDLSRFNPLDPSISLTSVLAVGPFARLAPGDTLQAVFAFLAGADEVDLRANAAQARRAYESRYALPLCPVTAIEVEDLEAEAAHGFARLSWRLSKMARERLAEIWIERASAVQGPYARCRHAALEPSAEMAYTDSEVEPGSILWYRLVLVGQDGSRSIAGPVQVIMNPAGPSRTVLHQPFEPAGGAPIQIRYSVALDRTPVQIELFDVRGRRVAAFDLGQRAAGEHTRTWGRRNDQDARIARGVYIVRLIAGDAIATRKLVLAHE